MKLFLTGGTGFIGSHFLRQALGAGHEVIALRRPGSRPRIPLEREPIWVEGELDADHTAALRGCEALVHLAAVGVSPQKATWHELFRWNVTASVDLWNRAADAGVKRLILCGSCMEYGRSAERYAEVPADAPLEPVSGYGACKAAASLAAAALAVERTLELAILRPFTVFGEGQHPSNFLPSLLAAARSGADFPMTPGEQVRDFQPVAECAAGFLAALSEPLIPGQARIRNLGTGRPRTLRAFAEERWNAAQATGRLLAGAVPYRKNEVMRFVPAL